MYGVLHTPVVPMYVPGSRSVVPDVDPKATPPAWYTPLLRAGHFTPSNAGYTYTFTTRILRNVASYSYRKRTVIIPKSRFYSPNPLHWHSNLCKSALPLKKKKKKNNRPNKQSAHTNRKYRKGDGTKAFRTQPRETLQSGTRW